MIELELRSLTSPDVEVEVWEPESHHDVWFLLQLEIGVSKEEGADLFQVVVATPEGLRKHARGDIISKRGTLILSNFSWDLVRRTLMEIIEECAADDWNKSLLKLQRYFRWEYEDYVQETS